MAPKTAGVEELDDPLDRLTAERERVSALVESLRQSFDDIVTSAADVATDDEHDPDGPTIAFERQQQAALLRETEAQLGEIEQAIGRFSNGDYGACATCGGEIPQERLEVLPATRHCVVCAAAEA